MDPAFYFTEISCNKKTLLISKVRLLDVDQVYLRVYSINVLCVFLTIGLSFITLERLLQSMSRARKTFIKCYNLLFKRYNIALSG